MLSSIIFSCYYRTAPATFRVAMRTGKSEDPRLMDGQVDATILGEEGHKNVKQYL